METVSALPALCGVNPTITGEFPSQRAGNADFDVFFDVSFKDIIEWTVELLVIWDAMTPIVTSL